MHLWATDGWIRTKILGGNVGQDMVRWASQVAVRCAQIFILIFFLLSIQSILSILYAQSCRTCWGITGLLITPCGFGCQRNNSCDNPDGSVDDMLEIKHDLQKCQTIKPWGATYCRIINTKFFFSVQVLCMQNTCATALDQQTASQKGKKGVHKTGLILDATFVCIHSFTLYLQGHYSFLVPQQRWFTTCRSGCLCRRMNKSL